MCRKHTKSKVKKPRVNKKKTSRLDVSYPAQMKVIEFKKETSKFFNSQFFMSMIMIFSAIIQFQMLINPQPIVVTVIMPTPSIESTPTPAVTKDGWGNILFTKSMSITEVLALADMYYLANDFEKVRLCYATDAITKDAVAFKISQANLGYIYYKNDTQDQDFGKSIIYYQIAYDSGMQSILPIILKLQLLCGYYDDAAETISKAYDTTNSAVITWLGWVMQNSADEETCNKGIIEFCSKFSREQQITILENAVYVSEWDTNTIVRDFFADTLSYKNSTRRFLYELTTGGAKYEERERVQFISYGEMLDAKNHYIIAEEYQTYAENGFFS